MLLGHGSDVYICEALDLTLFQMAISSGYKEIVQLSELWCRKGIRKTRVARTNCEHGTLRVPCVPFIQWLVMLFYGFEYL